MKLTHDRDIEFLIDPMDVDETNLALSIANITNQFEEQQAIPEKDSYRFSKLYSQAVTYASNGAIVDSTTEITSANVLQWLDLQNSKMDDAGVPTEGRICYCTSAFRALLKNAAGITRTLSVGAAGVINRNVTLLDEMTFRTVPSARFKTAYDFQSVEVTA